MLPFNKRFLCPTDFSDPSLKAIDAAGQLAAHFAAELVLLHVIVPLPTISAPLMPPATASIPYNLNEYLEEIEKTARATLAKIAKEHLAPEIPVDLLVVRGNAADEIIRMTAEVKADLIVIATHGWTGWRHLIFGSVAEKVIRYAEIPVLTIRCREDGKSGKNTGLVGECSS
ncbi:MAG: universal stress protein [Myxococcales bacterium]|nr:universal stress protein [Myxococcales bacterium]